MSYIIYVLFLFQLFDASKGRGICFLLKGSGGKTTVNSGFCSLLPKFKQKKDHRRTSLLLFGTHKKLSVDIAQDSKTSRFQLEHIFLILVEILLSVDIALLSHFTEV